MGLAVLPSRLKAEMEELERIILGNAEFTEDSPAAKHRAWFEGFADKYDFTEENTETILHAEIGNTFVKVLEDAGVYKCDKNGRDAFMRFIGSINGACV